LILLFTFFSLFSFSQEKKSSVIKELQVSANRTILGDDNTINKNGFGIGLNIIGSKDSILNFVFGIDLNATMRIKKEFYAPRGKVGNSTIQNVNVGKIGLSFSTLGRFHFGTTRNLFFEQGLFGSFPLDIGLIGGVGIIIPVKTLEFILKPSYVYGFWDISNSVNGPGTPTPIFNQFIKLSFGIRL